MGPALSFIGRLPEAERLRAELDLRLMEAMAVTVLHGIASKERVSCSERICQLSEPLGDTLALFRGLLNLGYVHVHRFEARRAVEVGRRCLKLTEHSLGKEMLPAAYALLTTAYYRAGNLHEAVKAGTAAMKGFASPNQRIAGGMVLLNLWAIAPASLSLVEHALGRPDQALKLRVSAKRLTKQCLGSRLSAICNAVFIAASMSSVASAQIISPNAGPPGGTQDPERVGGGWLRSPEYRLFAREQH